MTHLQMIFQLKNPPFRMDFPYVSHNQMVDDISSNFGGTPGTAETAGSRHPVVKVPAQPYITEAQDLYMGAQE